MYNPFVENPEEVSDETLVERARAGDRAALESLVVRHQRWIYNIATRMLWVRSAAEDATQEILIRMLTGLAGFRGESRFRTWLYQIAVNHILTLRSEAARDLEAFGRRADAIPDLDLPDPRAVAAPLELLVEEAKIGCMAAMLLCFDGLQRIVYTLGEILGVTDAVGAEVVGVTPANFRQILSRTRKDLYSFMNGRCGLAKAGNPCRCPRKTRALIEQGRVDPARLEFAAEYREKVRDIAPSRLHELMDARDRLCAEQFRSAPFQEAPGRLVRQALASVSIPLTPPA
jgi:RNA polymerase sigma factor (sigma-70 family)